MPNQHGRHLENERTNPYPDPVEVIGEYDLNSPHTWATDPHPSTHPSDPGDQVISEPPNERALRMVEFDQNHWGADPNYRAYYERTGELPPYGFAVGQTNHAPVRPFHLIRGGKN